MIHKDIESEKHKIYRYLQELKIGEAINQITLLSSLCVNPDIISKISEIKTTYTYMQQYMLQGVHDPQRNKLYNKLIIWLYGITDLLIDELLLPESNDYIYSKRRYYKSTQGATFTIKKIALQLKSEQEQYEAAKTDKLSVEQTIVQLQKIEKLQDDIFTAILSQYPFTSEERETITELLNENEYDSITSALCVSALTLSTLYFYDEKNLILLLDTYAISTLPEIKQRALCGALMICYIHRNRVELSDTVSKRFELFCEDSGFCDDIRNQFMQFIRLMETEKIYDLFTQEIIPEIKKVAPELKNIMSQDDLTQENLAEMFEKNPEWGEKLKESGLENKMKELNELQIEGSDVLLTSFSSLKGYSFFDEISNWVRPFTLQNSHIYDKIKPDDNIGEILLKSMFMCSSDRYSLALTMVNMNQNSSSIFGDIPSGADIDEMFNDDKSPNGGMSKKISNLYIQDLYRLFTLSTNKFKLKNIYSEHINLYQINILKPIFQDEEVLSLIGELYLKKEYYSYAQVYFEELAKYNPGDAQIYQKLGYCKQMQKNYQGAITEYIKADNISDDLWTQQHIAMCYRATGNLKKAIEYFNYSLQKNPDSIALELQIAHSHLSLKEYETALKYYYKVDFLTEGSPKTWQPIAWCLLMLGKYQQSQSYYEKIISNSPTANDYLNTAHCYFAQHKINEAYIHYQKSKQMVKSEKFIELYDNDRNILLQIGVEKEDIAIMRDILINS